MTFLVMAYLYVSPMQPAGTVLVRTALLDKIISRAVTIKGHVRVTVWRVVKVSMVVLEQLCFVWVAVEDMVVVVETRREEHAAVMLFGEQVAKSDRVEGPASVVRLSILRVVPLFQSRK
jgi:hypothetical protein